MAATSASRSWAFARRALAASAVAAVGLIIAAVPASAHTPTIDSDCVEKSGKTFITVELVKYNTEKGMNHVKITDNGSVLVDEDFGEKFSFEKKDLPGDIDHVLKVSVRASDDKDLDKEPHWSFDDERTEKACVKTEQPPTQPPTQPNPPTNPPAPPAPTTTTTPAPVGANANLAATGASIALPIGIGALLLVGGAVLLIVMRKRGRA